MSESLKDEKQDLRQPTGPAPKSPSRTGISTIMVVLAVAVAALAFAQSGSSLLSKARPTTLPAQAQRIDQKAFNVLPSVPPPTVFNGSSPFILPGYTLESLKAKPFHVYDDAFLDILGENPTLTLIAQSESDPLFHEAVVWSRDTDEVFFAQNAGAKAAGTGLEKSSIIQKISLADAAVVAAAGTGSVNITTVDTDPQVLNPNGGTNYRGQLVFAAEGQGADLTSALYLVNPRAPYNSTILVNNYFGRQFSSLNDVAVHPTSRDLYFTDTLYGYLQDFRPAPGLRNQVYRWVESTGALTVVADEFVLPNGMTFSPDGRYAYVTDTGSHHGFYGLHLSDPASIYRYTVAADGTFENRKVFAYIDVGVPDGVHCDIHGNVYAGVGDGVTVWSPSGTLLGKIFLGTTSANFQFASDGRLVIGAETKLYYATLGVEGGLVASEL